MDFEFFHFDIETNSKYESFSEFEKNDVIGANLFRDKYAKMKWDEKYDSIDDAYFENACIVSAFGEICCISCGFYNNGDIKIDSIYGVDEKDILIKFNNTLKKVQSKNFKLCGYRIFYFDIPWILRKMAKYGIIPAQIIVTYDVKPWEMRVVDLADVWKGKIPWVSSFDEVCYELGVESPKDKMDGSMVNTYFWQGKMDEVVEYCEKDIKASIGVELKLFHEKGED